MRAMNPIKKDFEASGVRFLAVNVYEEPEAARKFAETSGYDFQWARADDDSTQRLGITSIPAVIVIDEDGNVAWRSGLFTTIRRGSDLRKALKKLTRG
jgi:hypothetical protein